MTTVAFTPTEEQAAAISAPLVSQLIVAGAGAGKTTVMARRIAHVVTTGLARADQVRADQVLGLTFSNKAARHLKESVRAALGPDADVTVATYHSFGAGLVADHALELDLPPGTRVLDRATSWQLLYGVFDDFRFHRRATLFPQLVLTDALNLASRCADHLVPIEEVEADCRMVMEKAPWKKMRDAAAMRLELCQVVAAYQRRKRELNMVDFGDQVALAVDLLTEHPEVAADLRDRYRVVLLDEYQDTNYAQRVMLQRFCGPGTAVTAVGDDMQSIYGFRGAHLANIRRFTEHFDVPPEGERQLQVTFRFGTDLAELANRIQAQVDGALRKELRPAPDAPPTRIECFLASDETDEARTIASDIAGRGQPWAANAVLCRKRRLIPAIVAALEARGIPVEVVGASGLLERPEVVDAISWLEVLADPEAVVALLRLLVGPRHNVGKRDLAALARHGREVEASLASVVLGTELEGIGDLGDDARARLADFRSDHAALSEASARLPLPELVEAIAWRTGLWKAAGEVGRENLLRLLAMVEGFRPVEGDAGLVALVEYLQLVDDSEDDVAEAHLGGADAVRVMTIHQA